ncbi:MAG: HNH endonuclease, partial [Mycobacterium sp.]
MSVTALAGSFQRPPVKRVDVLFEELSELAGQRNAIDGRIVEIVAEIDGGGLWGMT